MRRIHPLQICIIFALVISRVKKYYLNFLKNNKYYFVERKILFSIYRKNGKIIFCASKIILFFKEIPIIFFNTSHHERKNNTNLKRVYSFTITISAAIVIFVGRRLLSKVRFLFWINGEKSDVLYVYLVGQQSRVLLQYYQSY